MNNALYHDVRGVLLVEKLSTGEIQKQRTQGWKWIEKIGYSYDCNQLCVLRVFHNVISACQTE